MFTKYFGLSLIAGGIVGSSVVVWFLFQISRKHESLSLNPVIIAFAILILFAIILTFLIGIYFYKVGKVERILAKPKMNKLIKRALFLVVASILIIPMSFFVTRMIGEVAFIFINLFGIVSATIMSTIAIIMFLKHWLRNRKLE